MFEFGGDFLIGTGPEGKVYKLVNEKEFKEYFKTQSTSVMQWVVKGGKLFLGTSNPGLVYRIDADHEGRIYYDPGFEEINGLGYQPSPFARSIFSMDLTPHAEPSNLAYLIGLPTIEPRACVG